MDQHKEEQLLYRISELIKENKELTKQLKELSNEKNRLNKEREKLENIIAQIAPEQLPQEMRFYGNQRALRFEMATVLYADLQGIKKIAREDSSFNIMDELDNIFLQFNNIVKKYKIEKIKTIGDTYMCAGGVPEKNITNPIDVVMAALEMQNFLNEYENRTRKDGGQIWDV